MKKTNIVKKSAMQGCLYLCDGYLFQPKWK